MNTLAKWAAIAALGLGVGACASSTEAPLTELDKGLVMLKEMRYADARAHYEAMLAREPNNPYVNLNLGAAYEKLGNKELAAQHYQRAIELGESAEVYTIVVEGQELQGSTKAAKLARDNLEQMTSASSKLLKATN